MLTTTSRRLPGIRFEAVPPVAESELPRMDVAAFVGFAACGPLGVPVPVEDVARFREVFGGDLPLAWDTERGRMQTAYLAAAVEAFFGNGGRRCWVVRVAGPAAEPHRFSLPGLYAVDNLLEPALARTRCPGSWADGLRAATVLESELLTLSEFEAQLQDYRFEVRSSRRLLQPGDLLRLQFGESGLQLLAALDSAEIPGGRSGMAGQPLQQRVASSRAVWLDSLNGSPPGDPQAPPGEVLLAEGEAIDLSRIWQQSSPPRFPSAERLTFEMLVWEGEEIHSRLSGLGFADPHPRFWTRLPSDAQRFRLPDEPSLASEAGNSLNRAPTVPKGFEMLFPLAGFEPSATFFIPWQMPLRAVPENGQGPVGTTSEETRLQRDGLESFSAGLFLDPRLAPLGSSTLLTEAHQLRYLQGRDLRGIHSLLPVEEASLIALPDAVQRGWRRAPRELPDLLAAPHLQADAAPDGLTALLSWTPVPGAESYQLELSQDPAFESAQTIHLGPETQAEESFQGDCPHESNESSGDCPQKFECGCSPAGSARILTGANSGIPHWTQASSGSYDCPQCRDCPQWRYFRVRALRGGESSPWSNTESLLLPESDFEECGAVRFGAPQLDPVVFLSPPQDDHELIQWSELEGAGRYRLQAAADPAFLSPETLRLGAETEFERRPNGQLTYFRVRAESAQTIGPWSVTRLSFPGGLHSWTLLPAAHYEDAGAAHLLAIQRALMRFCAARADLAAILSLPRHYRDEQALDHLAALRSQSGPGDAEALAAGPLGVRPLGSGEAAALGFGAVYHPWPQARRSGSERSGAQAVDLTPPEGAVCGMTARRTLSQGAWVAPANQPLHDVVSLEPPINPSSRADFFEAQLNLLLLDPRGFLVMSADTLSTAPDLRPLNVRRLLILLRRLALREGRSYVFEPNTGPFRRRVEHRFQQVLASLYEKGAFRGDTAESAFRVVTGESVNPPQSLEQGRFIVELRVAPSRPLAFVTVRLIQAGPEGLAVEEL